MSNGLLNEASNEVLVTLLDDETLAKGLRHQADSLDILLKGIHERLGVKYTDLVQYTMREAANRIENGVK